MFSVDLSLSIVGNLLPEHYYVTFRSLPTHSHFCLSSVCDIRAPLGSLLSQLKFSAMFLRHFVAYPSIDHRAKFYEDHPIGTLPTRENAREVAKYSDIGHVKGYILKTVQDTASGTIND